LENTPGDSTIPKEGDTVPDTTPNGSNTPQIGTNLPVATKKVNGGDDNVVSLEKTIQENFVVVNEANMINTYKYKKNDITSKISTNSHKRLKIGGVFVVFATPIGGIAISTGYYKDALTEEKGTFSSVGYATGADVSCGGFYGYMHGNSNLLNGEFISTSGSVLVADYQAMSNSVTGEEIGFVYGISPGIFPVGGYVEGGYGWHDQVVIEYNDNHATIQSNSLPPY
jgi:hypothetical protein